MQVGWPGQAPAVGATGTSCVSLVTPCWAMGCGATKECLEHISCRALRLALQVPLKLLLTTPSDILKGKHGQPVYVSGRQAITVGGWVGPASCVGMPCRHGGWTREWVVCGAGCGDQYGSTVAGGWGGIQLG